jgi:hypothetical protein
VDFEKTYVSVRREVLYNILIEFDVSMKLVRLIKIYLKESFSEVSVGKNPFEAFLIQNELKQDDLSPLFFSFVS